MKSDTYSQHGWVKKLVLALIFIVVLVVVVGYFTMNHWVQVGTEEGLTYAFQVPCKVGEAKVSILGSEIGFSDLVIWNPEGFTDAAAISMGRITTRADVVSLLSDRIVIRKIEIEQPTLRFEHKFTSSNLTKLLANLQETLDKLPAEDDATKKEGATLIVESLRIEGASALVATTIPGAPEVPVTLPTMELHDLEFSGQNKTATIAKLSRTILMEMIGKIATSGKGLIPDDALNILGSDLSGVGKAIEGATEGLGTVGKGATSVIKGLIPGTGEKKE